MGSPIWAYRRPSAFCNLLWRTHRRHLKRKRNVKSCPFCPGPHAV